MSYTARRLLLAIPLLLVVTLMTFGMLTLIKGDPAKVILGTSYTEEAGKQVRADLGLDKPFPTRYLAWLGKTLRGDLGTSYYTKEPVRSALWRSFPISVQLVVMAVILALLLAIPLGMLSAYRAGSRLDRLISTLGFGSLAMPGFVVGILLIFFVGLKLKVGGKTPLLIDYTPFFRNPIRSVQSMFLPALTIAIGQMANYLRILRTDVHSTLQENFVLVAKSKGLPDRKILAFHAFRPSSFTLVTVAGVSLGTLLGNAVIVEQLYGLNGIGNTIARAVFSRDYPTVLGGVTVVSIVFVLLATGVDLLYGVLDPRVRTARAAR